MKVESNMSSGILLFTWILNTFLKFQQRNIGTGVFLLFRTEKDQGKVERLKYLDSDLGSGSVIDYVCDLRSLV